MYANANEAYLESRVLTAEPIELVRMLYQAASNATRDARRHLAGGDILARSRSISKACAVLAELIGSLDRERGGEVASRLAQLYDYMSRTLIEANLRQADEPLAEVLELLATLSEAWDAVASGSKAPAPAPEPVWSQLTSEEPPNAGRYSTPAWSQPAAEEAPVASRYSTPAWSQPVAEEAPVAGRYSTPAWSQPVAEEAPVASRYSTPAWSQPVAEETPEAGRYSTPAWSHQFAQEPPPPTTYSPRAWSL